MRHITGIFITALLLFMFLIPAFAEQPSSGMITSEPTLSEMATQGDGLCMATCEGIITKDLDVNLVAEAIEHNQFTGMRDLKLSLRGPNVAMAKRGNSLDTIWIKRHTLTDTYSVVPQIRNGHAGLVLVGKSMAVNGPQDRWHLGFIIREVAYPLCS